MRFLQGEFRETGHRDDLLFKTLVAPVFQISYSDTMKMERLSAYDREKGESRSWMEVMSDKHLMATAGIAETERIHGIYQMMARWISEIRNRTLQIFFEIMITESGLLNQALTGPDHTWNMQLLHTLFDFIKEESVRNPELTLGEWLDSVDKMNKSGIPLPVLKILTAEDGVHFITGHSAKGLEFEEVFILGASADRWEKQRPSQNRFSYPDSLFSKLTESQEEDERRVFFVATTRAEKQLNISYATANDNEKEIENSRFVTELMEVPPEKQSILQFAKKRVADEDLLEYKAAAMSYILLPDSEWIDHSLIDQEIAQLELSVTGLNKYLRCPISYYFENIIRVPFARNANAGFGSAVHYALEQFFKEKKRTRSDGFGSSSLLQDFFRKGMHIYRSHFNGPEYENHLNLGLRILEEYHRDQLPSWFQVSQFEVEHHISNIEYRGVPIKGVIDKVEIFNDYVNVIDYKTGKAENARKKMKAPQNEEDKGGDYWRQIVFYKILAENDPRNKWQVKHGEMNLVEPENDRFWQYRIQVTTDDVRIVGDQLVDSYQKIMAHEFSRGCGENDCIWCQFVKDRVLLSAENPGIRSEED